MVVSASEMLVSDDEGAVFPTEMIRNEGVGALASHGVLRCLGALSKNILQPLQGSFSVNDTGPRQEMWHSHCLLNAPEFLQELTTLTP